MKYAHVLAAAAESPCWSYVGGFADQEALEETVTDLRRAEMDVAIIPHVRPPQVVERITQRTAAQAMWRKKQAN